MTAFPLPGSAAAIVAVPAPGSGQGFWAGSSSSALDPDGTFVLAYRLRMGTGPEDPAATVITRSEDGERYTTVATLDKSRFDAMSMERPALLRTDEGRWRLYTCCARKNSKLWWIDRGGAASGHVGRPRRPADDRPPRRARRLRRPGDEGGELVRAHGTGTTRPRRRRFEQIGGEPVSDARYLDVLPLPDGGYRIWYEAGLPDLSHELRTERIRP